MSTALLLRPRPSIKKNLKWVLREVFSKTFCFFHITLYSRHIVLLSVMIVYLIYFDLNYKKFNIWKCFLLDLSACAALILRWWPQQFHLPSSPHQHHSEVRNIIGNSSQQQHSLITNTTTSWCSTQQQHSLTTNNTTSLPSSLHMIAPYYGNVTKTNNIFFLKTYLNLILQKQFAPCLRRILHVQ